MAQILDKATVKARWARWHAFCVDPSNTLNPDAVLDNAITEAEDVFSEYCPGLTTATITGPLRHHLMNLIRYFGFLNLHGETDFERAPEYQRLFKLSLERLAECKGGVLLRPPADPAITDPSENVDVVDVHERIFVSGKDGWFHDHENKDSAGSFVDSS